MTRFFSGKSAADRGTLFHIKAALNHRNVKKTVMECFNHASDFISVVTDGYVCLLALKQLGITSLNRTTIDAVDIHDSIDVRKNYIMSVAHNIVNEIWMPYSTASIQKVIDGEPDVTDDDEDNDDEFLFCSCNEGN